jgi:hypothetical protein
MKTLDGKTFGIWLVRLGVLGFAVAVIQSFTVWAGMDRGGIPAASITIILLGLCFAMPSMLEDNTGGISTMRVVVLAVVLVFTLVYVKLGWNAGSFEDFTIDERWVYILGLAFGAKAAQRFAETDEEETPTQATQPQQIQNIAAGGVMEKVPK